MRAHLHTDSAFCGEVYWIGVAIRKNAGRVHVLDVSNPFKEDGLVRAWRFLSQAKSESLNINLWRRGQKRNSYLLISTTKVSVKNLGENLVEISPKITAKAGDFIGWSSTGNFDSIGFKYESYASKYSNEANSYFKYARHAVYSNDLQLLSSYDGSVIVDQYDNVNFKLSSSYEKKQL
jgi:hypothetical protein